jgi:YVTN family beta-propeller protein
MISQLKPPLEEEGEVFLYIQPFPQEADRLRFRIEGISLRKSDGMEIPLTVKLADLRGRDMTRQRLLGSAQVPPGSYTGLSFKVKDAHLKVEDGDAALLVADVPTRIDLSFQVSRKRAYLISLAFRPKESILGGIGFSPVFSVSIPPKPIASLTGYVTNYGSNNITVFDKKIGQATGVIATGRGPAGMVLDQIGRRAYVAIPGDDTIEVIDVAAGEVTDKIRLTIGDHPQELALTPDGRILLAVNPGSNTISVIDLAPLTESSRINVGNGPSSILVDRSGRRAYAFNTLASTISVIDILNRALVATIATDPGPLRGQFNRQGDRFYVIHELSSYLSVIDANFFSVTKRLSVGMGMRSIKVDTNTDLVYLGKNHDIVLGIYEPLSFVAVDYLQTGGGINYMTIDGDENNLVVVMAELQRLMITNLISKKALAVIDVGEGPYWVTLMGER